MSRKNILRPFKMFDAVVLDANRTSSTTSVVNIDNAHIFIEWSGGGSPSGTLAVEARHFKNQAESGTWFALDGLSAISISGNSGSHQIFLDETPFSDIRLVYTRTSGSANLTATIQGKVVGA